MSEPLEPGPLRPLLARPRGFRLGRAAFRGLQRVTRPAPRRYYLRQIEDRHTAPRRELVPDYSLIAETRKPAAQRR